MIVVKNIKELIPKLIGYFLVNSVIDNIEIEYMRKVFIMKVSSFN